MLHANPADVLIDGEPQECGVCENETMIREGGDDFGYGHVAGTCMVCSYRRSDDMAYSAGMDDDLAYQMAKRR